jgi:hypothetical protein
MTARPGNMDIQLDLFLDYANNIRLYPSFHESFRKEKPPLLAIWGKHDPSEGLPGRVLSSFSELIIAHGDKNSPRCLQTIWKWGVCGVY